jgi:hypothetical protein
VTDNPSAATPKKGCLRRFLGCLGTAFVLLLASLVALAVLPGRQGRAVRDSVKPGMSVEEVVPLARGWLSCRAYAGPPEKRTVEIEVWPTRYGPPFSETHRDFATSDEMARALRAEMGNQGGPWKMSFGYITMSPNRIYFDVEFSPDGRVTRVSETRWGTIN